ncbi:MAG TPA: hypothetical protein VH352_05805 [Pseudonocardiaceae bacterium]|nr:hypothetical protein [Pseudonocardiaceae bacterium]
MPGEIGAADVVALANAYRQTLIEGDRRFTGNAFQRRILHSVVTASAQRTRTWLRTRVQNGHQVAEPLADFTDVMVADDKLHAVQRRLASDQFTSTVVWYVILAAKPLVFAFFAMIVSGIVLYAGNFGDAAGKVLWPLVFGGGTVAVLIVRAVVLSARSAAMSLLRRMRALGTDAEGVFVEQAGPVLANLYARQQADPGPVPVVPTMRRLAVTLVFALYTVVTVALVFFVLGMFKALGEIWAAKYPG